MSRRVPVGYADRTLWAYDVSFAILLLEAIRVAAECPQPDGAGEVLDRMRANAEVGASYAFSLDNDDWTGPQRDFVHRIIAEAGRRLRERGVMTRAEAEERYGPSVLRFETYVDGAVIDELADAMDRLIRDDLPPVPTPGDHWFYGLEGGPSTT